MKFNFNYKLYFYIIHLVVQCYFTLTISNLKTNTQHQQQQQPMLLPQLSSHPCSCAVNFHCPPCNSNTLITESITTTSNQLTCPCVQCPPCISISLMHDLSSKKAMHDQQATLNLKKMNDKIGKYFDVIIKSLSDVVNYEQEARDKAKLMEEASIKAMIARRKMIDMSEKARYIAKMGIVERKSCINGDECEVVNGDNLYEGRIFPEEVSAIKEDDIDNNNNNNKSLNMNYLSNNT